MDKEKMIIEGKFNHETSILEEFKKKEEWTDLYLEQQKEIQKELIESILISKIAISISIAFILISIGVIVLKFTQLRLTDKQSNTNVIIKNHG